MRIGVDLIENIVEHCDQQVDKQNIGHQQVDGHDDWRNPPGGDACDLTLAPARWVDVICEHLRENKIQTLCSQKARKYLA